MPALKDDDASADESESDDACVSNDDDTSDDMSEDADQVPGIIATDPVPSILAATVGPESVIDAISRKAGLHDEDGLLYELRSGQIAVGKVEYVHGMNFSIKVSSPCLMSKKKVSSCFHFRMFVIWA